MDVGDQRIEPAVERLWLTWPGEDVVVLFKIEPDFSCSSAGVGWMRGESCAQRFVLLLAHPVHSNEASIRAAMSAIPVVGIWFFPDIGVLSSLPVVVKGAIVGHKKGNPSAFSRIDRLGLPVRIQKLLSDP